MNKALSTLAAVGLGALAMYYLDPKQGNSRRALARDKAVKASHTVQNMAQSTAHDLANRSRGLASDARSLFDEARAHIPSGDQALGRAQSLMGRTVATPGRKAATAATGVGLGLLGVASQSVLSRYPLFAIALGILGYV